MNTIFNFTYNGDTYEVALHGFIIARITCYFGGTGRRQDVSYDDLPQGAKEKILLKAEEQLRRLT